MKIGIYGGAFDPFHNGHLSMIRGVIASKKVDRVIVIPTGMPCFKPARKVTLSPYRFYMVKTALKDGTIIPGASLEETESVVIK